LLKTAWARGPKLATPRQFREHEIVDRYRKLSICLIAASVLASATLVVATRTRTSTEGTALLAGALAASLLLSAQWWKPRGMRRLSADLMGTLAVGVLSGLSGSALALLGLKLHLPLADARLRAADHMIGIDAVAIVERMSWQQPWFFRLMSWGYHYTMPTIAATMVLLSIFRRVEAWRVALCFAGTLMSVCAIAVFIPAKGIGMWADPDMVARLPKGSINAFWPTFDTFYGKSDALLALKTIDGVISFPSFHAAMACIVLAAWRINLVTFFIASIWFAFLMLGTLPYGGHYFVDLVAGCLVWLAWFLFSKRLERSGPTEDWRKLMGRLQRARAERLQAS